MARDELGGWLSGPGTQESKDTVDFYRGERLGFPEDGPGSVAGFGRRIAAIFIDWFAALFFVTLVTGGNYGFLAPVENAADGQWIVLGVFALEVTVLLGLTGMSLGHRVMGLGVVRFDGKPVGLLRALVRTVLLCLVIPAVIWDRDGRGFHDKAVNTIVIQRR